MKKGRRGEKEETPFPLPSPSPSFFLMLLYDTLYFHFFFLQPEKKEKENRKQKLVKWKYVGALGSAATRVPFFRFMAFRAIAQSPLFFFPY